MSSMPKRWGPQASQRHFCKVCKIFIQPDKKSILHHELNNRHKNNLRRLQQDRERNREREDREKARLETELARLDAAARTATSAPEARSWKRSPSDLRASDSETRNSKRLNAGQGFKEGSEDSRTGLSSLPGGDEEYDEDTVEAYQVEEDAVLGQYSVDGVLYLEGVLHEDLLQEGCVCEAVRIISKVEEDAENEVFPGAEEDGEDDEEPEEDWRSAKVVKVSAEFDSTTDQWKREYTVRFDEDGLERSFPCTDLRIVAPPPPQQACIDMPDSSSSENGGWSTVSVRYAELDDKRVGPSSSKIKQEKHQKADETSLSQSSNPSLKSEVIGRTEAIKGETSTPSHTEQANDSAEKSAGVVTLAPQVQIKDELPTKSSSLSTLVPDVPLASAAPGVESGPVSSLTAAVRSAASRAATDAESNSTSLSGSMGPPESSSLNAIASAQEEIAHHPLGGSDAYATFNPFGGDYKGVNLDGQQEEEVFGNAEEVQARSKVKFKKRKKRS
mmetsp:Transcript_10115/g.19828  ORF Transcript_10115/g.19828 Transcript_10115/m.19828 type:complete len:502 (+) Transcript_10115:162-1667(+)|eukprot:CAMPEP_0171568506 /NCGR_PEP_ID=MMETSP0961-20121227/1803_1 /TAXON_ID=87120 /ORGANISM="Aurantiochytrium limacinum, Strain ATCCMYA-1381" /LENGTH=501 /DNA_ID=CAMNT_0012122645 /DNA_START=59 /DNA_END=1564 /DNA_ORIENTATION=-